jgi:hypothetical protein
MAFQRVSYKQTCILCKKNKVLITSYKQKPICAACGMREFSEVTEEPFKTMFDIPQELYVEIQFLRSIRSNYHKFGSLSEKQIEAFNRVVAEQRKKQSKPAATASAAPSPVPEVSEQKPENIALPEEKKKPEPKKKKQAKPKKKVAKKK